MGPNRANPRKMTRFLVSDEALKTPHREISMVGKYLTLERRSGEFKGQKLRENRPNGIKMALLAGFGVKIDPFWPLGATGRVIRG